VCEGVWTFVGNGLSNQTFVQGPEGIIAIDTGECVEEMKAALAELRSHTDIPIVAVLYTHFHYVAGTSAIDSPLGAALPIYGHERIVGNIARAAGEIGPAYARGLVQQVSGCFTETQRIAHSHQASFRQQRLCVVVKC